MPSSGVDSTSDAWKLACTILSTDEKLEPKSFEYNKERCDAWFAEKKGSDYDDYVATAADMLTIEYAYACGGATSLTAFGVAIIAAITALAF